MSYERALRGLAFLAVLPAAVPVYFFCFWRWFGFFSRHRALTYAMILLTVAALGVPVYVWRREVFALQVGLPRWVQGVGWAIIVIWSAIGSVADRQIGLRVRSFGPHFEGVGRGRIRLRTTGAYGIVRHPIYAAGIFFILGTFLVTGALAVLASCLVFTLGALWFTRREEERTMALLDDPGEYERYRARVPGLFPRLRRRHRRGPP